jgi:hypothetical protein
MLRRLGQPLHYRLFRLSADDPVNQLSIFKDEHSGYARDLILPGRRWILVYVQFGDAITTLRLGGKLVHDGPDDTAWPTPWRPTIEKNGLALRLQYLALECRIGNDHGFGLMSVACTLSRLQLRSASAAFRFTGSQSLLVDPILCSAFATNNYLHSKPSLSVYVCFRFDSSLVAKVLQIHAMDKSKP